MHITFTSMDNRIEGENTRWHFRNLSENFGKLFSHQWVKTA